MLVILIATIMPVESALAYPFTVTYVANGANGVLAGLYPVYEVTVNSSTYKIASWDYKKDGVSCIGYNTLANGRGTTYHGGDTITLTDDLILYAIWELPVVHKITYNPNGGTGNSKVYDEFELDNHTVVDQKYTKSGAAFIGYNTQAGGGGDQYSVGTSFSVEKDVTLYAQWIDIVTITYDSNGGTGTPIKYTINKNGTHTVVGNSFTKPNYSFAGYYTTNSNGSGSTYNPGQSYNFSANTTLYAQWKIQTVTVTYNANGGTGQATDTVNMGSTYTVTNKNISREGYTFIGYNTQPGGGGTTYTPGSSFTASGNITLYAQWLKKNSYAVTYDPNGGNGQPVVINKYDGESFTVSDQSYTREAYRFVGYNTSPDGIGTMYNVGTTFTVNSNVTLYTQWAAKTVYTIKYYPNFPNGGTGSITTISVYGGDNYTIADMEYKRHGFVFTDSYNSKADGTGTAYHKDQLITISDNMTLYAIWHKADAVSEDSLEAVVTKLLKVPNGASVPAVVFRFEAERLSEDDTSPTDDMPEIAISDVAFLANMNESEFAYTDTVGTTDFYYLESDNFLGGVDWQHPGIYKYLITETNDGYADDNGQIKYSKAKYVLTVVVSNTDKKPEDGLLDILQLSVVLQNSDNGKELGVDDRMKVDPRPGGNGDGYYTSQMIFTNEYRKDITSVDPTDSYEWKLSVSNKVAGLISDQSHYFEYSMTLTAPLRGNSDSPSGDDDFAGPYTAYVVELDTNSPAGTYLISASPSKNGADNEGKIQFNVGENTIFHLKHNQYLVFPDIPEGIYFTVSVSKDVYWIPGAHVTCNGVEQGFESRNESTSLAIPQTGNSVFYEPLSIGTDTYSIDFVNTRKEHIDTRLNLNSLPFIVMIALILGALITYIPLKLRTPHK